MLAILLALLACSFAAPAREEWPQLADLVALSGAVCPVVLPEKKAPAKEPEPWEVEVETAAPTDA